MTRRGIRLAHFRRVRALLCAPFLLMSGCLVTESIEFPVEEDFPPIIDSRTTPAIGSLLEVRQLEDGVRSPEVVQINAVIRDLNVTQTLEYTVQIDQPNVGQTTFEPGTILENDRRELRNLSISIPANEFPVGPSCSRVDLTVTGAFEITNAPEDDRDIARWWVEVVPENDEVRVDVSACPQPTESVAGGVSQ